MEEKFIIFLKDKGLSENTYNSYVSDIKIFKKYYFDSYGEELTTLVHADIKMYSSYMIKIWRSATTINRVIAAIKQYNLFLIEEKIQDNIVILDKDYIKIQKSIIEKNLPTEQEVNKLQHSASRDKKILKEISVLWQYLFMVV